MKTESTTSSELLRSKTHRINKSQKDRIVLFFDTFLKLIWEEKEEYSLYLGGSQSKHSKKLPCEISDIDIYIFLDRKNFISGRMIEFDEIISEQAQLSLGMKINVYLVDKRFIESVSQGMELLK